MNLTKKLSYSEAVEFIEMNKSAIRLFYVTKGLSARVVAEKMNVHYNMNWQKALLRVFGLKGLGLGGARPGSGNKKGITFCPTCGKAQKNCECK